MLKYKYQKGKIWKRKVPKNYQLLLDNPSSNRV